MSDCPSTLSASAGSRSASTVMVTTQSPYFTASSCTASITDPRIANQPSPPSSTVTGIPTKGSRKSTS